MSKHPLDHQTAESTARLTQFAKQERAAKPSEASKRLQQRPRTETESRLAKFTKIERKNAA